MLIYLIAQIVEVLQDAVKLTKLTNLKKPLYNIFIKKSGTNIKKEYMKQTLQRLGLTTVMTLAGLATSVGTVFAQGVGEAAAGAGGNAANAGNGIDIGTPTLAQGFAGNLGAIISGVLGFVMAIAALLVFLYLILGGIQWITSGGDKGKTEEARNKITGAVIGLIILAAAYAVLQIMLHFLGLGTITDAFKKVDVIDQRTGNI